MKNIAGFINAREKVFRDFKKGTYPDDRVRVKEQDPLVQDPASAEAEENTIPEGMSYEKAKDFVYKTLNETSKIVFDSLKEGEKRRYVKKNYGRFSGRMLRSDPPITPITEGRKQAYAEAEEN